MLKKNTEAFAVVGCHMAHVNNCLPTFQGVISDQYLRVHQTKEKSAAWPFKMGLMCCSKTLVTNYRLNATYSIRRVKTSTVLQIKPEILPYTRYSEWLLVFTCHDKNCIVTTYIFYFISDKFKFLQITLNTTHHCNYTIILQMHGKWKSLAFKAMILGQWWRWVEFVSHHQ